MTTTKTYLATRILESLSTKVICELIDECETVDMPAENTVTRSWLYEELERRNPQAFDAWQAGPSSLGPGTYFK